MRLQIQNFKLIGLTLLLGFILQGCIAEKGKLTALDNIMCNMDSNCVKFKPKITKALNICYLNPLGGNIEDFFDNNKKLYDNDLYSKRNVYNKFLKDKNFKETNLTYQQVKEECQTKYQAEKIRLEQEEYTKNKKQLQEKQAKQEKLIKKSKLLAEKNGYKGFVIQYSLENFIRDAEEGRIDINDYKKYVIASTQEREKAYKFSQLINNIEVYQPDYRFRLNLTIGIKRSTEKNTPLEGQVLKDVIPVSFIGVETYTTILGVQKQILMFDRAEKFRTAFKKNR